MPADVDEHGRLDIQHETLKIQMGALYYPVDLVRRILAPRPPGDQAPAILDIGTGSGECAIHRSKGASVTFCQGSWAVDMAEEFPHAEVVGVDIVPANLAR